MDAVVVARQGEGDGDGDGGWRLPTNVRDINSRTAQKPEVRLTTAPTTPPSAVPTKSDFLAAEEIRGVLVGRDKVEQEKILRWVCESLDLSIGARPKHEQSNAAPPSHPPVETHVAERPRDIRTFMQEKTPKSAPQFATAVAYYYRFVAPSSERKEAIKAEDLQHAARLAQRPVLKTPSDALKVAARSGFLDRAAVGEYRINTVGENLVVMTMPGGENEKTGVGKSKKKAAKKKAS